MHSRVRRGSWGMLLATCVAAAIFGMAASMSMWVSLVKVRGYIKWKWKNEKLPLVCRLRSSFEIKECDVKYSKIVQFICITSRAGSCRRLNVNVSDMEWNGRIIVKECELRIISMHCDDAENSLIVRCELRRRSAQRISISSRYWIALFHWWHVFLLQVQIARENWN